VLQNFSASCLPANRAPRLGEISNQTVNVGRTVALPALALDTNLPPLTLTFDLLGGPAAATLDQINNSNAVFTWRPAVSDANTTNIVLLSVANNGLPSLSATQSFSIVVNPLVAPKISAAEAGNGGITLRLDGQAGPDYAVEISTNLLNWNTVLITNSPAMPWQWTDTNQAALPAQFYRLKMGPPLP
jgi:hypothetical protein